MGYAVNGIHVVTRGDRSGCSLASGPSPLEAAPDDFWNWRTVSVHPSRELKASAAVQCRDVNGQWWLSDLQISRVGPPAVIGLNRFIT